MAPTCGFRLVRVVGWFVKPPYNVLHEIHKITLHDYIKLPKSVPRATLWVVTAQRSFVGSSACEASCVHTTFSARPA